MRDEGDWNPFEELQRMLEALASGVIPVFGGLHPTHDPREAPFVDVTETDTELILTVELPGVPQENIIINASSRGLEIEVEHVVEEPSGDVELSPGIRYGEARKLYEASWRIDPDGVKASYKNGVLEVRAPKLLA